MEKLIFVSADSHATPPPEVFPDYIPKEYHHLLPEVMEDNERYTALLSVFSNFPPEVLEVIDQDGAWSSGGYKGFGNVDIRLEQMDREGVAAEFVYAGDARAIQPLSATYHHYPQEVLAAGMRAYNRWAHDEFGKAKDRILLVGDPAAEPTIEGAVAELKWMADHGFRGAMMPMNMARHELPPLYDAYWDPFWAAAVEYNLVIACHAGYGGEPCEFFNAVEAMRVNMEKEGRTDLLNEIVNNSEHFFALDLRPRRAMWQLMLGGVFDRFPDLRLMMTEVRGDWAPATMAHLDEVFEKNRDSVISQRRPSEYWASNCIASLSFIHKAEVGMRHEIGLDNIAIGRDYPHAEGTWPNSKDWVSDVFQGVPDEDLKKMLGENMVRILGLDRAHLQSIANRIGLTVADITGRKPDLDPRMIQSWDLRGGYLKPAEKIDIDEIDKLLFEDIAMTSGLR